MKPAYSFLLSLFVAQFVACETDAQGEKGVIIGTVLDLQSQETLAGANVFVVNAHNGAASDSSGVFEIKGLKTGTYTLECSFPNYQSISVADVKVGDEKPTPITFVLSPSKVGQQEIFVDYNKIKKFHRKDTDPIDPHFTIEVDKSVDPDMVVAVDPSVDPKIFIGPLKTIMKEKNKNSFKVRILDTIKDKPEAEKDRSNDAGK
jgi:hypothetical protein